MTPVIWTEFTPPTGTTLGTIIGNDGAYLVSWSQTEKSVVPFVRKTRPNGTSYYEHVEPDYNFSSVIDAMKVCERHKLLCPSMFTTVPVDTKPKNSNRLLGQIVSALSAGKQKDSNGESPKCASPNLEALLSRKRPGAQGVDAATKDQNWQDVRPFGTIDRLAGYLLYSKSSISEGLRGIGLSPDFFDLMAVRFHLEKYGVEQCRLCQRWEEHNCIFNGYCINCDQI